MKTFSCKSVVPLIYIEMISNNICQEVLASSDGVFKRKIGF
jgi:hypothetical protein